MRIAFMVDVFPKLSETFILGQITGLLDRGHDVDIYTMAKGDRCEQHPAVQRYGLLARTCCLCDRPANRWARVGGALARLASRQGRPHWKVYARTLNVFKYGGKSFSLFLLYAADHLLRRDGYDAIHCQFGTLGPLALLLKQLGAFRGALVVAFRGYDATRALQDDPHLYDQLFREADLFLPVSESLKRKLVEAGCDERKIRVHHSGLDLDAFVCGGRTHPGEGPVRVVTIARLAEKKGVGYGLEAVARAATAGRNIRYTVVGDGPLRADLDRQVEQLHLGDCVQMLGNRSRAEIVALLADSHILLAPSVTAANGDQEGIPNSVKEAMAAGMPVVGTFHSGIPELVEDGVSGLLAPERDAEALSQRLGYMIDHPEIWPAMVAAGRARVEQQFDIQKLNGELEDIYRSVQQGRTERSSRE